MCGLSRTILNYRRLPDNTAYHINKTRQRSKWCHGFVIDIKVEGPQGLRHNMYQHSSMCIESVS